MIFFKCKTKYFLVSARHSPWHNKDKIQVWSKWWKDHNYHNDNNNDQNNDNDDNNNNDYDTDNDDNTAIDGNNEYTWCLCSSEGCASTRTLTRNCKEEEKEDKESKSWNLEYRFFMKMIVLIFNLGSYKE